MLFMVLASQSRSTFTKQGSSTVAAKRKCVTGHTGPGTWPGCHLHCRYTQARFRIPNCTWVRRKIFFTGSSCCCSIYACVIVLLCSYFKYVCKALLCIVRINWKYQLWVRGWFHHSTVFGGLPFTLYPVWVCCCCCCCYCCSSVRLNQCCTYE